MSKAQQVSSSSKQFSEIVKEAKGDEVEVKTAYRFSNGRTFDDGARAYEAEA